MVPSRHVLPTDLPNAVRHLNDQELDQLLSAIIAEQKRRGRKLPAEMSRKQRVEVVAAIPLTQGKLNAVRAGRRHAIENCPTVRDLTVGYTQGVGV